MGTGLREGWPGRGLGQGCHRVPAWACGPAPAGVAAVHSLDPSGHPRAGRPPETVWGHAGDRSSARASILFLVSLSGTTVWGRTLILHRKEVKAAAVKLGARPPLRPAFTAPQPPLGETVNQAADGLPAEGAH